MNVSQTDTANPNASTQLSRYAEIQADAIFTPTMGLLQGAFQIDGETHITTVFPSFLDELATNGYLAIQVPHAPPTYTESVLLPGIPDDYRPGVLTLNYYSPPTSDIPTTVAISMTRRTEYEGLVNEQFPISDGQSHWEVWWLPKGATFPTPDQPFAFKTGGGYGEESILLRFRIDFVDAPAMDCPGCTMSYLLYNGYTFLGPYEEPLVIEDYSGDPVPGSALVGFDQHCQQEVTALQYLTPGETYETVHWLENYDTQPHTFDLETTSSQGWDYQYYTFDVGGTPTPAPLPFTVEVPAGNTIYSPGCLGVMAVYTPTLTAEDTFRETLTLTATDTQNSASHASTASFALAPGYQLNENGNPPFSIWLPLIINSAP